MPHLADYCILNSRLSEIIPALADGETVTAALGALATPSSVAPLSMLREHIDAVFALDSVRDVIARLTSLPDAWARQAHSDIMAACPLSLELTFRSIREARTKSLRECLVTDFRIAQRLMQRSDYFEGVRARIIDKDNGPRWAHTSVQDVPPEEVDACFAPLGPSELQFDIQADD
jgi:enoyl-CoA hydratase